MKKVVIIDEIGKIYGRDGIFLDFCEFDGYNLILKGEFNGNLCENVSKDVFINYKITFSGVLDYRVTELDYFEKFYSNQEYISSFEEIIDSEKINFGNRKLRHFLFYTYDYIFEIVCEKFDKKI